MVLHQNCQFSAVSINGVPLAPGTYTFNNLLAQFPGNFAPGGSGGITVTPAPVDDSGGSGTNWYVDSTATGLGNGTSWVNAWTDLNSASGVNPGDTVYISGGNVSQTYWLSNTTWQLANGTNNNPVTYTVGQDAGHNGTVILNGGGTQANAVNATLAWVTIDGSYDGQNNLIISNFTNGSFLFNGCNNVILRHVTVYGTMQLLSPIAVELDHITHYPPPGATEESVMIQSAITPDYYPGYFATVAGSTSYTASLFLHDSMIYVLRDGVVGGNGDVGISSLDHSTVSNCTFASIVNPAYNGGKHQEAIQTDVGHSFVRIMDSTFVNMEYAGIFGGMDHDYQILNNLFYYTDPLFTNGSASVCVILGEGGLTNLLYNFLIANNTFADANYGLQIGPYDTVASYSNVVVVNNLCTNNSQAGISCVGTNGASTNNVVCFDNKAGGNTVTPANLAGPSTSGQATFISYTPYAANNDFHLATNDTGAVGNGTNWPAPCFTADKDGNPCPVSGPWAIGAYQYNANPVTADPQNQPPLESSAGASVALNFTNIAQTCKTRTKVDHTNGTTNFVTSCNVSFDLVASNNGATESPAFPVRLWTGQGSVFDPRANPLPMRGKVKALEKDQTAKIRRTLRFNGNQAGAFLYATDTNNNVLTSVQIPDSQ